MLPNFQSCYRKKLMAVRPNPFLWKKKLFCTDVNTIIKQFWKWRKVWSSERVFKWQHCMKGKMNRKILKTTTVIAEKTLRLFCICVDNERVDAFKPCLSALFNAFPCHIFANLSPSGYATGQCYCRPFLGDLCSFAVDVRTWYWA